MKLTVFTVEYVRLIIQYLSLQQERIALGFAFDIGIRYRLEKSLMLATDVGHRGKL
jgi:hypothetical protein